MANIEELKTRARRHEASGRYERATACYLEALETQRAEEGERSVDPSLYLCLADLHFRQGDPDEAIGYYERAAERYAEEGLFQNAISVHRMSLRLFPEELSPYRALSRLYRSTGNLEAARENLEKYVAGVRERDRSDLATEAMREFVRAVGDPEVAVRLAQHLDASGAHGEAMAVLREARRRRKESGQTTNRIEAAARELEPGLDLTAWDQRGDAEAAEAPGAGRDAAAEARGEEAAPGPETGAGPDEGERVAPWMRSAPAGRPERGERDDAAPEEAAEAFPWEEGSREEERTGKQAAGWRRFIPGWEPEEESGTTDEEPGAREPVERPEGTSPSVEEPYRPGAGPEPREPGVGGAGSSVPEAAGSPPPEDGAPGPTPVEDESAGSPPGEERAEDEEAAAPSSARAEGARRGTGPDVPELRRGLAVVEELLELAPGRPDLLRRKAAYARRLGDETALREAWLGLADVLAERDAPLGARLLYSRVLEAQPGSARARAGLAEAEAAAGGAGGSMAGAAAGAGAPAGVPTSGDTRAWLDGRLADALERESQALPWLHAAARHHGSAGAREGLPLSFFRSFGRYLMLRGRLHAARDVLSLAAEASRVSDADRTELLYDLSRVHTELGETEEADGYRRRIAAVDPGFRIAREALAEAPVGG